MTIKYTKININDKFLTKLLLYKKAFYWNKELIKLIDIILNTIKDIDNGYISNDIPKLEINNKIIEESKKYVINKYSNDKEKINKVWKIIINDLEKIDIHLASFRTYLIDKYNMYFYVSNRFIKNLDKYLKNKKNILEIMSGSGYVSLGLQKINKNRNIIATDNELWKSINKNVNNNTFNVEKIDAIDAIYKYAQIIDIIIMCWAPDTDQSDINAIKIAKKLNKDINILTIKKKLIKYGK